ncbi:hypothetical protein HYX19_03630 [Candidatus Woesearchaeota archaeon]|nr:hypothetical protein [Candidatus Woesearchaeota archaeon]
MAYDSSYYRFKRQQIIDDAVDKTTRNYGRKLAEKLERGLNRSAVEKAFKRLYDRELRQSHGVDTDIIERHVSDQITQEILQGRYQTASKVRRFLRGAKQVGRKEVDVGGFGFYATHPLKGLKRLFGYEEDRASREKALSEIIHNAPNEEVKEKAGEIRDYLKWEDTLEWLYRGRIGGMKKGKFLRAENKLRKKEKKEERDLVKIVRDSIAVVAFIGAVAFIANTGGAPFALTGSAILEKPAVIGDGLIIGIFLFLIALGIRLTSKD